MIISFGQRKARTRHLEVGRRIRRRRRRRRRTTKYQGLFPKAEAAGACS
jgi:hypothetical protein